MSKIFPSIGLRMIKSGVAVAICLLVNHFINMLIGTSSNGFYIIIAALLCIQPDVDNTVTTAANRMIGTAVGAVFGLIALFIARAMNFELAYMEYIWYLLVGVITIACIYANLLIRRPSTSFFSSVVFLGIALAHNTDMNPWEYVLLRFFETAVGIAIAFAVNAYRLPRKKGAAAKDTKPEDENEETDEGPTGNG